MIIETERLILRPFTENDAADAFEYLHEPMVHCFACMKTETMEEARKAVLDRAKDGEFYFAITLKENGKVIGSIGLEERDVDLPVSETALGREIGYVLSKDYWGRGIMPEAVHAVIDYLFNDLDLDFLICGYYDFNKQSKKVQEKCGFKPYRRLVMDTLLGTTEPGILNLLLNPNKNISLIFSHPETLIYK